jgi:hypothetical protein
MHNPSPLGSPPTTQVRSISLRFDPLQGGSEIHIEGIGFFHSPAIVVRFQPVGQAQARAAVGTFQWDKIANRKFIRSVAA